MRDVGIYRARTAHTIKTNGRKTMNGSKLNEHRTKRVPILHWIVILALAGAALVFGSNYANSATGVVEATALKGFNTCMANKGLTPEAAQLHAIWENLVKKVEAFEAGTGPALTANDIVVGRMITTNQVCGTFANSYPVLILDSTTGYFLFKFDPSLGFGEDKWIIYREGVVVK